MSDWDDRAQFEREELAADDWNDRADFERQEIEALARQYDAERIQIEPGVWVWQFPAWVCPHCSALAGPDAEVQPGCPSPLARHGPMEKRS